MTLTRTSMPNSLLTFPSVEGLRAEKIRPQWVNSARYNSVFDWTARLSLVFVLSLLIFANVSWIVHAVGGTEHRGSDHLLLNIAARASSTLFVALVAATTLTRLRPLRKAAGLEPRLAAVLGTFLVTMLAMLPRQELPPIALGFASMLIITGALTSFVVLRWLGRSFSIMAEARQLVTYGPYRFVRHPLYVCEELAAIGVFIQVISPLAVVILIMHGVFQIRRMLNEETVLRATFPEYEHYARLTPRLIPFRWWGKRSGKSVLPTDMLRSFPNSP
jgi:protein-S-isoprenylcysteine O-methyltransferase Ste14